MSPVVSKKMHLLTVAVSDTAHCPCPRLHRFRPASHKSATRAVFMKKGNPERSQIPFNYSNGAEGGTRTPGNPFSPLKRPLFARDLQSMRTPMKISVRGWRGFRGEGQRKESAATLCTGARWA